jgi:hypothetical protein
MNVKNDIKKWVGWDERGNIDNEGFRIRTGHYQTKLLLPRKRPGDMFNEFTERNAPELIAMYNIEYGDVEYNI